MTFNRQKTVRPQALNGSTVLRLSVLSQLLYLKLGHFADDYGKEAANATLLRGSMFPRNPEITDELIEQSLVELADVGLARLYSVDGEEYFLLTKWALHWKVDTPSKSDIPSPPPEARETPAGPSRVSPEEPAVEEREGGRGQSESAEGAHPRDSHEHPPDPATLGLTRNRAGILVDSEGMPSAFCDLHQPFGTKARCRTCGTQREAMNAARRPRGSSSTGPSFEPDDE